MAKFIAALLFAASMVVFAQAKAEAGVVVLPQEPTMEDQLTAVQAVDKLVEGELEILRMVHRNCDGTMNVLYYESASQKWAWFQNVQTLGARTVQKALNERFGSRDWSTQIIGTVTTATTCEGAKQMQFEPEFRAVTPKELFEGADQWIEINPGRDFYFILIPRCDFVAWAVYGHNAIDPNAADMFLTYAPNKEYVWRVLTEEWGDYNWEGEGPEMLITQPDSVCIELATEVPA
jgi:hypothetical protein